MYDCLIWSNSRNCTSNGTRYKVNTKSAMKCAKEFGRAELGETVSVYKFYASGEERLISRVIWNHETASYVRVSVI